MPQPTTQPHNEHNGATLLLVAVSVLVCTRNRGDEIVETARTVLNNIGPELELIVVDQSDNDDTAQALAPFLSDPRLRYLRPGTKGKGKALNFGVAQARAEIIAITDDDCIVPTDWLEKMTALFADRPKLAVAFCNVDPAPHDAQAGFIPNYRRVGDYLMTRVGDRRCARGIGAGMAIRKSAVLELGGFDEMLGPGAAFPSFDETDIALRALLRGRQVYETGETSVVHYGFRTMDEGRELVKRDCFAIGGGHAKLIKCGEWRDLPVCLFDFWLLVAGPTLSYIVRLKKPPVLKRGVSFIQGFLRGLKTPVDKRNLLFKA